MFEQEELGHKDNKQNRKAFTKGQIKRNKSWIKNWAELKSWAQRNYQGQAQEIKAAKNQASFCGKKSD